MQGPWRPPGSCIPGRGQGAIRSQGVSEGSHANQAWEVGAASCARNAQAEGAASAKAPSGGRKDTCLSSKRPLWLQKVSKRGEEEEVRLEGPGTGRA